MCRYELSRTANRQEDDEEDGHSVTNISSGDMSISPTLSYTSMAIEMASMRKMGELIVCLR